MVLVVVDEAVLALTGYELADPLGVFYQPLHNDVWAAYGLDVEGASEAA